MNIFQIIINISLFSHLCSHMPGCWVFSKRSKLLTLPQRIAFGQPRPTHLRRWLVRGLRVFKIGRRFIIDMAKGPSRCFSSAAIYGQEAVRDLNCLLLVSRKWRRHWSSLPTHEPNPLHVNGPLNFLGKRELCGQLIKFDIPTLEVAGFGISFWVGRVREVADGAWG